MSSDLTSGSVDDHPLSDRDRLRYRRMLFFFDVHPYCLKAHICRKDCASCRTCPVCGGTLAKSTYTVAVFSRFIRKAVEYTCVHCGSVLDRGQFFEEKNTIRRDKINRAIPLLCAVRGCEKRVWDQLTIRVDGKDHMVCDRHEHQYRRWIRTGRDENMPHLITGEDGLQLSIRRKG